MEGEMGHILNVFMMLPVINTNSDGATEISCLHKEIGTRMREGYLDNPDYVILNRESIRSPF